MVLGSGIALLDSTVVGIALPSIGRDFHGGVGTLQWVVTGYALTLAAFLLLGRLPRRPLRAQADLLHRGRLVRRRVGRLRHRTDGRAAHRRPGRPGYRRRAAGAGQPGHPAGLVPRRRPGPGHRRLVRAERRGRRRRPAASGATCIAVGSWRWVFFINLPLSAAVLVITARHVPESRDPARAPAASTSVGAALAVVFLAGADLRAHRRRRRAGGRARPSWPAWSWPPWRRPPSSSSSTAGPIPCSRSSCSAPASSAGPTASPSPSTAPSAAPSSCSPSSCRSSRATRRSSPASRSSP